MSYNVVVVMIN